MSPLRRELEPPSIVVRVLDDRRLAYLLPAAAALVAFAVTALVYPNLSWNRDEPVFLWQADLLLDRQLTQTDGGFPDQFQPWLSAHRDGSFFGQYPLGWPGVLALAKLLGAAVLAPAAGAALFVAGGRALAAEITGSRRRANATGLLLLGSPLFLVQSGVYLNYLFSAGIGAFFTVAMLRGVRETSRRWIALAGLLLGVVLLTRTYDTVVWALAVGGFLLVTERHRVRELLPLVPVLVAAILPALVVQVLHNLATTGSPTTFALSVADPLDRFGFGPRRMMPELEPFRFSPTGSLRATAKNLFFTPWFVVGAHLGALAAIFGAWVGRATRATRLLLVLTLAFPLAYVPFWGIHISSLTTRISGPIYYIPLYLPLTILTVQGLVVAYRRAAAITTGLLVLGLAVTVPVAGGRLGLNRQLSRMQGVWSETTDGFDGPTLAIISPSSYLVFLDPGSMTRPDHPDRVIYATDRDPRLIELIETTDRPARVLTPSLPVHLLGPAEDSEPYEITVRPATVVTGERITVDGTLRAPADGVLVVDVSIDDETRTIVDGRPVTVGEEVAFDFDVTGNGGAGHDVFTIREPTSIIVTVGVGPDVDAAREVPMIQHHHLADLDDDGAVRILEQGRFHRPNPVLIDEGKLIWLEDLGGDDLRFALRADPTGR